MNSLVSQTTINNWTRLKTNSKGRLRQRANKTLSTKRVVAANYAQSKQAMDLLEKVLPYQSHIEDIIYTLCIAKLKAIGIYHLKHVKEVLEPYVAYSELPVEISPLIWNTDEDLLGFVYQSLLSEGERNATGQYYTQAHIVQDMVGDIVLQQDKNFYDPCCGSGAFLLGVKTKHPENLFGSDINPIAVLIAKVNLLAKYKRHRFIPNIVCGDFLTANHLFDSKNTLRFDYICTNPPWGTDKRRVYHHSELDSKEKASQCLFKALQMLKSDGYLKFLLPYALLNIDIHKDIRSYIIHHSTIDNISIYHDHFDGVFTKYFSIQLRPKHVSEQQYCVIDDNKFNHVSIVVDKDTHSIPLFSINPIEQSIQRKVENKAHDYLTHSQWALGIVTGNNKEKLLDKCCNEAEAIYTGKEIQPYRISPEKKYIYFIPSQLQQCAKEAYYRASEKLIYRFIATKPVFAYDNRQRLCLNSANILIPQIDTMSIKSVAAFLNSSLYRYLYTSSFHDVKVLKSNLSKLPFPKITKSQDIKLVQLVDEILQSGATAQLLATINEEIYKIFDLSEVEKQLLNSYQ